MTNWGGSVYTWYFLLADQPMSFISLGAGGHRSPGLLKVHAILVGSSSPLLLLFLLLSVLYSLSLCPHGAFPSPSSPPPLPSPPPSSLPLLPLFSPLLFLLLFFFSLPSFCPHPSFLLHHLLPFSSCPFSSCSSSSSPFSLHLLFSFSFSSCSSSFPYHPFVDPHPYPCSSSSPPPPPLLLPSSFFIVRLSTAVFSWCHHRSSSVCYPCVLSVDLVYPLAGFCPSSWEQTF